MNLIDELGGYAQAKALRALPAATYDCGIKFNREELELSMLEYRRQHNIFEVGDIAVNRRGGESRLLKIWKVDVCPTDKRMSIADYDADGLAGWSRFHCLRHAEPEELEAGKRLEVNQ